jgi:hypothetical protein
MNEPNGRRHKDEKLQHVITLARIPTYREFVAIKKVARIMLAIWHPDRDRNPDGTSRRDPDERDDNWMIR